MIFGSLSSQSLIILKPLDLGGLAQKQNSWLLIYVKKSI